ncbi:MAG: 2-oxoacid:acceptor oxidoreductase subunit alpha [Thermoprotei archaeon]|nr:MAG: 2-oxoacid:acceptor oxidoreductase subunit alpha [Thermoprotei archaeon]
MEKRVLAGVHFWEGNVACAEGALAAECSFFAGYPITPQREIMERMASRLPLLKGVFLQVEDEIAAINAVIGASWAGAKAMTATSGPGFSLMQEAIGYMVMTETPGVIVDVQRLGPATGQATKCGQGDVMQARWGRHGDQAIIALCPNSAQEMFDLTVEAFNLSERYRCPVIVLADEIVGHLRERVEVPSEDKIVLVERRRPYSLDEAPFGSIKPNGVPPMPRLGDGFNLLVTGSTHDEYGYRHTASPMVHSKLVTRLVRKIMDHVDDIVKVELQGIEEAEVGVVSYGCTSRSVYEAIKMAEDKGVKVGHVRLKTIWPFPDKPVKALSERVDVIVVPELNLGQISLEVRRVAREACRVVGLNKVGGGRPITPREVVNQLLRWRR